jgi:hypothetical protein
VRRFSSAWNCCWRCSCAHAAAAHAAHARARGYPWCAGILRLPPHHGARVHARTHARTHLLCLAPAPLRVLLPQPLKVLAAGRALSSSFCYAGCRLLLLLLVLLLLLLLNIIIIIIVLPPTGR